MFHCRLLWIFALFTVCSFCRKDFQSLGRHRWRCKKRLDPTSGPNQTINITLESDSSAANVINVKCSCGKECKEVKGLKMHQRRCRVIEHMEEEEDQPLEFKNSNIGPREHFNDDPYVLSFDPSSTVRPRLHGIGSKTIRIDMGTDRPCVYTGPGVSVYFWICYPNTFGFAFKSGYFWIRTLSIPCKRMDRIQKCTDRK